MDKRPTCTFPYIKIIGEIKEENDRIVFKGITDNEGMGEYHSDRNQHYCYGNQYPAYLQKR